MSEEINRNASFLRQMEFADPAKFRHPVTIFGVGSVGSSAAIALGKMGQPRILLVDRDLFEEHNVANQFCLERAHVGKPKVDAVRDLVISMSPKGVQIVPYQANLTEVGLEDLKITDEDSGKHPILVTKAIFGGILVNCPDDMNARKWAWEAAKFNPGICYVIDIRVAAQYLQIILASNMQMDDVKRYEATLHSNEEASVDPCGARGIIYTSMVAGAMVANFVKKIQLSETLPQEFRMDLHSGMTTLVVKGKEISDPTELALVMVN